MSFPEPELKYSNCLSRQTHQFDITEDLKVHFVVLREVNNLHWLFSLCLNNKINKLSLFFIWSDVDANWLISLTSKKHRGVKDFPWIMMVRFWAPVWFPSPAETHLWTGNNMRAAPGVAACRGNYRRRRQRTGPELYGGPLCDCCFFLSTPAILIAGLVEGGNKELNPLLLYLRERSRGRECLCLIDMRNVTKCVPCLILLPCLLYQLPWPLSRDNGCVIAGDCGYSITPREPSETHRWKQE